MGPKWWGVMAQRAFGTRKLTNMVRQQSKVWSRVSAGPTCKGSWVQGDVLPWPRRLRVSHISLYRLSSGHWSLFLNEANDD